ncbi:MAG: methyltransferase domain-containing protein [Polyangiaceae bacterium]
MPFASRAVPPATSVDRDDFLDRGAGARLGPAEAAVFETFVVPRYLSLFGDAVLELLTEIDDAQVAHVGCRTGFPDRGVALKLHGAHIYGCDASSFAVELARTKAATMPDLVADYRVADTLPVPLPAASFSHAMTLHPQGDLTERTLLWTELGRLLAPNGQVVVAMPVRGSFQEIADLLREYALKNDVTDLAAAVDAMAQGRPSVEMFGAELEDVGFRFVDIVSRTHVVKFQGGRDVFEDPLMRLLVLPQIARDLGPGRHGKPFAYVREAIDKYWSDGPFELTVQVGAVTARR